MTTQPILTLGVLAGAYRAGRASLRVTLTHSMVRDDDRTLCGRIHADHMADEYAGTPAELELPPTCPVCLRRDPRFGAKR